MEESNNKTIKIAFLGTPTYVESILKSLEDNFDVVQVFRDPKQLNNEAIEQLKILNPDLFVVAAFGKILSSEVLDIPRLGTINVHPSLLPIYRGPSPVQWTILEGQTETGVTLILMDEQVDHGVILWQEKVILTGDETFESLVTSLFKLAADNIAETIKKFSSGEIKPTEQNHNRATFTKMLTRESGFIDIDNPPANLSNMIRAFYPWPGVWLKAEINGQEKIVKLLPNNSTIQQSNNPFLIQVEGKKEMSFKDFINGYKEGYQTLQKLNLS